MKRSKNITRQSEKKRREINTTDWSGCIPLSATLSLFLSLSFHLLLLDRLVLAFTRFLISLLLVLFPLSLAGLFVQKALCVSSHSLITVSKYKKQIFSTKMSLH